MRWILTYLKSRYPNFHTVVPKRLYRSATPKPDDLEQWHEVYGIKTWLDLRMPKDYIDDPSFFAAQCAMARRLGIERISLPLDDFGVVTDEQVRVGLEILTDETKFPILFGCRGARHRAGLLCAVYRMRVQGWSGEKALEEAKCCGYYPNKHRTFDKRFRQLLGLLLVLLMAVPAFGQSSTLGRLVIDTSQSEYATPSSDRNVICPVCEEAGKKSTVRRWTEPTTYGFSYTPSINYYKSENRYWDEDGKYHDHELAQEMLICSAGHRFWDFDDHRCWCDWPNKRYVVVDEVKGETITLPEGDWKKLLDHSNGITYTPNGAVIMPMSYHPYIQPERTLRDVLTVQSDSMAKTIEPHRPDQRFDRSFWIASGLFAAASTADIITTHKALERGAVELNPIFGERNGAGLRTTANALATTGIWGIAAYCEQRGQRRFGRILLLTGAAIRTAAAFWNHTRRR